MATLQIPILRNLRPDTSGKVWREPYGILATNDVTSNHLVWRFDEDGANNAALTTKVVLYGSFKVPKNYVGTAVLVIDWTSTIGSGDCVFDLDYRAVATTEGLDQGTFQESVTATATAPSANNLLTSTISITGANLAVDDVVQFQFGCDGTDGADTLAGARLLVGLHFRYNDS